MTTHNPASDTNTKISKTTNQSTPIIVGQKAPSFEAMVQYSNSLTKISLYNILQSGQKVLLIFYPGDNTPGCTLQLCGVRDIYDQYTDLGVTVLAVNHANAKSHLGFVTKQNYPFGIVVDEDKSIRESYGAVGSFFGKATTKRSVFLIDTDGTVIYKVVGQHDNSVILELLHQFRS